MNTIQAIKRINERELEQGLSGKASWHHEYKDSAWIFAGGFPYDLTEGDVLCVMSQWGEIEDINLCRDKDTGKSKGFCFVKYEDQRSTILAVDNFNGIELLGRTIRVDHKHKYALPAEVREKAEKLEEERVARGEEPSTKGPQWRPGIAYEGKQLANEHNFHKGVDVYAAPGKGSGSSDESNPSRVGMGGERGEESAAAKRERREAKRARKEARREARERKKHKSDSHGRKKGGEDSAEDAHSRKNKKGHKKDKRDDRGGRSREDGERDRGRGEGSRNDHGDRRRGDNGRYSERGGEGGVDAAGVWERGARIPGGEYHGSFSTSNDAVSSRPAAPASLAIGSVLDWRGLGGRGNERGGRGGRGGREGREGNRGRGRGGRGGRGDRGSEGMNSIGGMDRRR
ncbi:unnamed protein product [Ascophyllum nodosum]